MTTTLLNAKSLVKLESVVGVSYRRTDNPKILAQKVRLHWEYPKTMNIFGLSVLLFYFKLSDGNGVSYKWYKIHDVFPGPPDGFLSRIPIIRTVVVPAYIVRSKLKLSG